MTRIEAKVRKALARLEEIKDLSHDAAFDGVNLRRNRRISNRCDLAMSDLTAALKLLELSR
jgi:hypothetical protein